MHCPTHGEVAPVKSYTVPVLQLVALFLLGFLLCGVTWPFMVLPVFSILAAPGRCWCGQRG